MSIRDIKYLDFHIVLIINLHFVFFTSCLTALYFLAPGVLFLIISTHSTIHPYFIQSTHTRLTMKYTSAILYAALAVTPVFSHGVITEVKGANGPSTLCNASTRADL